MTVPAKSNRQISPLQAAKNEMESAEVLHDFMTRLGGDKMKAQKFVAQVIDQYTKSPTLAQCNSNSVREAVYSVASLNLNLGGHTGEAYLVPFKDKCTLILGYRGLMKLARRDPSIDFINVALVYDEEVKQGRFEYRAGSEQSIRHDPIIIGDRGHVVGGYAIAKLKDGSSMPVFMRLDELDRIKSEALAKSGGRATPWKTHLEEMYKKTLLRRACKLLPANEALDKGLELEEDSYSIKEINPAGPKAVPSIADVPEAEPPRRPVEKTPEEKQICTDTVASLLDTEYPDIAEASFDTISILAQSGDIAGMKSKCTELKSSLNDHEISRLSLFFKGVKSIWEA